MLKLSKTECLILANALQEHKFSLVHDCVDSKKAALELMGKLNELQEKLSAHSDDERMYRRRLTWDYGDRVRWYAFKTPDRWKLPKDEETPESNLVYDRKAWTNPAQED